MKNLSFSLFNVISVITIILLIFLIVLPFNLMNLEQAERIAKWKSEYEKLNYEFSLINTFEGSIIPKPEEIGKILSDEYIIERIIPYLNVTEKEFKPLKKYKYKKMNRQSIPKNNQFYFKKFIKTDNGLLLSVKQNNKENLKGKDPLYFLFVDINGIAKPNIIGHDIFFINIYRNNINAVGYNLTNSELKADCSPISGGIYCSEYYLLGGRF